MMKFLKALVIATFVMAPAQVLAQASLNIVAKVNEDIITEYDVAQRIRLLVFSGSLPNDPEVLRSVRDKVLDTLVVEKLQLQEATKAGLSVNADQKRILQQRRAEAFGMEADDFIQRHRRAGIDEDHLTDMLVNAELWLSFARSRFAPRINISEADINLRRRLIEENRAKPERRIFEIFIDGGRRGLDEAKNMAEKVYQDIVAGADFRQTAVQVSEIESAANGGERGWLEPGRGPSSVEARLDQMQPGTVSKPFLHRNGYMILWLAETRARQPKIDGKSMISALRLSFPNEVSEGQTAIELVNSYRAAARTCSAMEGLVARLGEPSEDMGTRRLQDYPREFQQALATLPIGQVSEAVVHNGGETISAVMACNRKTNDDAAVDEEEIRQQLVSERMVNYMDGYLKDMRRSAFIEKLTEN